MAQTTLIYTPSNKQTCHENYHAKNNCTSLSQIIFSCKVKLKCLYIYIYTHKVIYIHIRQGYIHTIILIYIYWVTIKNRHFQYCSGTKLLMI
jgi:hypothetical protein